MRRDQYVLKNIFKPPITSTYVPRGSNSIHLDEHIHLDENNFFDMSDKKLIIELEDSEKQSSKRKG